ncbi:hypothetical protein BH18ACT6_BH18ACT6_00550 [soil metagenome]
MSGDIDGAWVPEPWATRLVLEGGGEILVDERDLWPDGAFVTTHLIVRTEFLEANPEVVAAILRGLVSAVDSIEQDPAGAQQMVNDSIESLTGSSFGPGGDDRCLGEPDLHPGPARQLTSSVGC